MKPVVLRLYALLVVLAVVGLIAWSGADWYQRKESAENAAQTVLRQTAGAISQLALHQAEPSHDALSQVIARGVGGDVRWKMLLLSSQERGTEYYRGPRPAAPVELAVPHWEARSATEIKASLPVFRAEGAPLVLEGIYEFYGRTEIFSLFKACGLTLVVLLLLTTVIVFLASRSPSEPEPEAEYKPFEPEAGPAASVPPSAPSAWDDLPSAPELEIHDPIESEPDKDEYWFDENLTLDLPEMEPPAEAFSPPAQPEPSLFSPATGMGWESFLATRLDNELQRCADQNQDLALVLLAMKDGSFDPKTWGNLILKAFPSVDLDFEYDGGAALILPGKSLEQALKAARGFLEHTDRAGVTVHAGVAARTGRLLSAQTLLTEAESAKRRSLAGSVRVLGLKTDPDRYREHLAAASV